MPVHPINGVALHYRISGDPTKPTVVLCHTVLWGNPRPDLEPRVRRGSDGNAHLAIVEESSHLLLVEKPQAVVQLIRRFLTA